ncbi:hypothetical protein [Bernardetia sp.]|uniref:hypothetical protein n=1 Tax=Bernardetia sp. TaxID=1937974 RepID=UPI0025B96D3E|nr:hypothetical protein [Bernardetia sp.]
MKSQILLLILIGITQSVLAQVGNEKSIIVRNKVKESFEKHRLTGSNSDCTTIIEKYDKNGNTIEWKMGRMEAVSIGHKYDENDNLILTYWIDKSDNVYYDSTIYRYDQHGTLIQRNEEVFKNTYDSASQLIKQTSKGKNRDGDIIKETKIMDWTSFGKIKTKTIKTEMLDTTNRLDYKVLDTYRKEYEYHKNINIAKEIHYKNDTIINTISYKYDVANRLIDKREKDIEEISNINYMTFRGKNKPKNITELITKISYNKDGSIKEKYTHFFDPCMSLNNHYLFKHFYKKSGLLEKVDVYEEDNLIFTISYEYKYFE